MMRSKPGYAVALLRKSGRVTLRWFPAVMFAKRHPFFARPFVRGMTALFESMVIGVKALMFSASEQEIEVDNKKQAGERDKARKQVEKLELSGFATGMMVAVSFIFGLGLFVALPSIMIELFGVNEASEPFLFNVISGLTRIAMFVGYIALIALMKDVRRVFEFHGAEHKAVNCYEAGRSVTLANARKFTTLHPRCGTSFMFFVLLIAILLFAFVPLMLREIWPGLFALAAPETLDVILQKAIIIPLHILLLPLVSGLAYEVIRISWRYQKSGVCRILMSPGLMMQKITTREPDENQIRVAVKALNEALRQQNLAAGPKAGAKAAPVRKATGAVKRTSSVKTARRPVVAGKGGRKKTVLASLK